MQDSFSSTSSPPSILEAWVSHAVDQQADSLPVETRFQEWSLIDESSVDRDIAYCNAWTTITATTPVERDTCTRRPKLMSVVQNSWGRVSKDAGDEPPPQSAWCLHTEGGYTTPASPTHKAKSCWYGAKNHFKPNRQRKGSDVIQIGSQDFFVEAMDSFDVL